MPERRGRTAAMVLRDLLEMGWQVRRVGESIEVAPPPSGLKEAIRRQLEFGRNDQLGESSTRRFLFSLERPGRGSGCRPVTDLIADGRRLAAQLAPIAALPRAARAEALAAVCRPYLELVTDERDPHSGIRRMDIWRYFRHMWATRYRTSPGRNLFYLIRDAAQPNHPVMGITALGNTVMQLGVRDRVLGWTVDGLLELIQKGVATDVEVLTALVHRLEEDFGLVYSQDLPVEGRLPDVVPDSLLSWLKGIEEAELKKRAEGLRSDPQADDRLRRPSRISACNY
jgi:hypothetical protein